VKRDERLVVIMTERKKPWGGRFSGATDASVEDFTASIDFDKRLYRYDITGSIAHCRMLAHQGIISDDDARAITTGLGEIQEDIEDGRFSYSRSCEDIHMAIEQELIERIGDVGGKLHSGRSRNDQIALDIRMYLRDEVDAVREKIRALQDTFVTLARREAGTVMPGYTHLQKAQPVLLGHYFLAFWEMLERDGERLKECRQRINVMPLGSGALAGTGLPIDREYVAELLHFPAVTQNSMDAVSDRDFVAEFLFDASLVMTHLSRLCEDLIIWSSDEFGYIVIADSYTTGSSLMPQKKNPDVAELVRGKTGRVYGNLTALLTLLKGLPMTYNRDLQEDKEPLFDTVDTVKACLSMVKGMLEKVDVNREKMHRESAKGFAVATDIAEYLVMRGVPFREAHHIVGRIVAVCIADDKDLFALSLGEFRAFSEQFDDDVMEVLSVEQSVNARTVTGGTSPDGVMKRSEEIGRKEQPS